MAMKALQVKSMSLCGTLENAEPLHINLYGSSNGRFEWNHVSQHNIDRRWSTTILSHSEIGKRLNDRNGDSFLDTPLSRDFVLRNEWKYLEIVGFVENTA